MTVDQHLGFAEFQELEQKYVMQTGKHQPLRVVRGSGIFAGGSSLDQFAHNVVRAALRRLIRKYYAKTRDGQGNVIIDPRTNEPLRMPLHNSKPVLEAIRLLLAVAESGRALLGADASKRLSLMDPAGIR